MPSQSPGGITQPLDTDPLADIALAVRTALGEMGDPWIAYTPVLSASITNPTLGSGGSITGAYRRIGKTVHWRVTIDSGTTPAAGSGNYEVTLPFASKANVSGLGQCYIGAAGTPAIALVMSAADATNRANIYAPALVTSASNNLITGRKFWLFGSYERG